MSEREYDHSFVSSLVEILAGAAMVVIGVILQVVGSSAQAPSPVLTVTGGILVALGGLLLSWTASRNLADRQRHEADEQAKRDTADAMSVAQSELDEKLSSLSRVLGQAAGQISQTVEKVESGLVSGGTGFELVSQANRMIYGQVNEIAVIRKSKFDSAYLLDTASTLDDLARELSSRTHSESGTSDSVALASVREKIEFVREGLSSGAGAPVRALSKADTTCPYCDRPVVVELGNIPGDTASATCTHCGEVFNAHRNAAGGAFTRKRGPRNDNVPAIEYSRWSFACPNCSRALSSKTDGKGDRLMVCPKCFAGLEVDPDNQEVVLQKMFKAAETDKAFKSGSRPKAPCPGCGEQINMMLRYADGYFGYCAADGLVLTLPDDKWTILIGGS